MYRQKPDGTWYWDDGASDRDQNPASGNSGASQGRGQVSPYGDQPTLIDRMERRDAPMADFAFNPLTQSNVAARNRRLGGGDRNTQLGLNPTATGSIGSPDRQERTTPLGSSTGGNIPPFTQPTQTFPRGGYHPAGLSPERAERQWPDANYGGYPEMDVATTQGYVDPYALEDPDPMTPSDGSTPSTAGGGTTNWNTQRFGGFDTQRTQDRVGSVKDSFAYWASQAPPAPTGKADLEAWMAEYVIPGMEADGHEILGIEGDKLTYRWAQDGQVYTVDYAANADSPDMTLAWGFFGPDAGGGVGGAASPSDPSGTLGLNSPNPMALDFSNSGDALMQFLNWFFQTQGIPTNTSGT